MCSTPFGVTEFCTGGKRSGSPTGTCAQRLSASLSSAPWAGCWSPPAGGGAQRLSASLSSAQEVGQHQSRPVVCSTPFGVTEFCTPRICQTAAGTAACSTPFGVTEFCTRQRLQQQVAALVCSTPFGVTEFCTAYYWNAGKQPLPPDRFTRPGFDGRRVRSVAWPGTHNSWQSGVLAAVKYLVSCQRPVTRPAAWGSGRLPRRAVRTQPGA